MFPVTKYTGFCGGKRTGEGLLAERYLSGSSWHRLQLQKQLQCVFLLLMPGFTVEFLQFVMLM